MRCTVLVRAIATDVPLWLASTFSAQQVRVSGTVASEDPRKVITSRLILSAGQPSAHRRYTFPDDDFELVVETDPPVYVLMRGRSVRLPPLPWEPGADVRLRLSDGVIEVRGPGSGGPGHLYNGLAAG